MKQEIILKMLRNIISGFLGLIVASAMSTTIFAAIGYFRGGASVEELLPFVPLYFLFSLIAATVLGVPMLWVFKHFEIVRWWSSAAAGLIVGMVAAMLIKLPSLPQPISVLSFGLIGAISAIGFWLVWQIAQARLPK